MLIQIDSKSSPRRVGFTRIIGEKGEVSSVNDHSQNATSVAAKTVRITTIAPAFCMKAWSNNIVEVQKLQPSGDFAMPDILLAGSEMQINLLPSAGDRDGSNCQTLLTTHQGPAADGAHVHGTGCSITVKIAGSASSRLRPRTHRLPSAAGLPLRETRLRSPTRGPCLASTVSTRRTESQRDNGDIAVTLPQDSSAQVNANAWPARSRSSPRALLQRRTTRPNSRSGQAPPSLY